MVAATLLGMLVKAIVVVLLSSKTMMRLTKKLEQFAPLNGITVNVIS
jgi:hypothetical protein